MNNAQIKKVERLFSKFIKTLGDMMLHGKDMRDQSGTDYIAVPAIFLEIVTEELNWDAEKLIAQLRKG